MGRSLHIFWKRIFYSLFESSVARITDPYRLAMVWSVATYLERFLRSMNGRLKSYGIA